MKPSSTQVRRPRRPSAAAPLVAPKSTARPAARPDPSGLRLRIWPDPVLTTPAAPVGPIDDWLREVIARMIQLMAEHQGVGLAGPQVGLPLRVFVMSPTGKADPAKAFVNPVLSRPEGQEEAQEGCLSLPEIRGNILRYTRLQLDGLNPRGEPVVENLEGLPARIAQHETDHLDGILIIDRMSPLARMANRKKLKELRARRELSDLAEHASHSR